MEDNNLHRSDHLSEAGATTAEYAVTTGCGIGFAGVLYKFLTSETGQRIISDVFEKVVSILPF